MNDLTLSLTEIAQGLNESGLQTLLQPAGPDAPARLLLGLGQDYQGRDQIVRMTHHNAWLRQMGVAMPEQPCIYSLEMQLPLTATEASATAEFLDELNRRLPAGQYLLLPDGQIYLRYHWLLHQAGWTLLPLVHWIELSAYYLQQALEPMESVCSGASSAQLAITQLEHRLNA
jgi:hypothetical protein